MWATGLFLSGSYWLQQLVVGWFTFDTTGSAILTSIALGLDPLPFLLLGPVGGIIADRWDRRYIASAAAVYLAVVTLGLGVMAIADLVVTWHMMVYALAIGVSFPIMEPSRAALTAKTVPKANLLNAFALNGLAQNASRLVFPIVGGVVIALFGPGQALIGAAVFYVLVAVTALRVDRGIAGGSVGRRDSAITQFWEGARYARREPVILGILLIGVLLPLTYVPSVNRMMPVYASEVYSIGPTGLGLLMGAIGVGSTLGTVVLALLGGVRQRGRVIVLTLGGSAAGMIVFSQMDALPAAIGVLVVLSGTGTLYWSVSGATVQAIVPDDLRGRVSSLSSMSMGLFPVGSLLFGGIAQLRGAQSATATAGLIMAFCVVFAGFKFRDLWNFR